MFNRKPRQGVEYLQEQGYLDKNFDAVVKFLKETPKLNKALIGEYISRKNNPGLTTAFMRYDCPPVHCHGVNTLYVVLADTCHHSPQVI